MLSAEKKVLMFKLVVAVLVTYSALLVYAWMFPRNLVYQPGSGNPFTAQHKPFQSFVYHTPLGLNLRGLWLPPKALHPTILFFHGREGHVGDRTELARKLSALGYGVALVEYRGYGGNPGVASETNMYEDARAAIASLQNKGLMQRDMVLYGEELGAGVAIQMATEMPGIRALVLDTPHATLLAMMKKIYWFLPVHALGLGDKFENIAKMRHLKMPVLFLDSDDLAAVRLAELTPSIYKKTMPHTHDTERTVNAFLDTLP